LEELRREYEYCWGRLVQPLYDQEMHSAQGSLETAGQLLTKSMGNQFWELIAVAVGTEEVQGIKVGEARQGLVKSLSTSNLKIPG
jgi:hypothetical protein